VSLYSDIMYELDMGLAAAMDHVAPGDDGIGAMLAEVQPIVVDWYGRASGSGHEVC